MQKRLLLVDVWRTLDLDVDECLTYMEQSPSQQGFRRLLFSRIVPALRDISLFTRPIREYLANLGVLEYESFDLERAGRADELAARMVDAERRAYIEQTIKDAEAEPV